MILPRNFNLEVGFRLAMGATLAGRDGMPRWHGCSTHPLGEMFSCFLVWSLWSLRAGGLSNEWPFSLERQLMVVLSRLKFAFATEARKRYLMTTEASALSGEINNSGYQGLTRIHSPRIYRKSPPKHHFYVRNFFAKTLENVDEWVISVKSAVRYASLFVRLVVC